MEKSAFTKLPALLLGLVLGVSIGALGTHRILELREAARLEAAKAAYHYNDMPEEWLFPPGTRFEDLFPDADLRDSLLNPDSIQIHAADESGTLVVRDWKFSEAGVAPDERTAERLKHALGSMSSYRGATMCGFHADVLLRLEKNGRVHDLVFCFGCGDIAVDGGGPSMTADGQATFFKCFCDSLPDFKYLHEKRAAFEARR